MIAQPRAAIILTLISLILSPTSANTEKAIFLGPEAIAVPSLSPAFEDLNLITLTPFNNSIRLSIPRAFPNSSHPRGLSSWYLLSDLEKGRRYEVRICWVATAPTEFWLKEHAISGVFNTPDLISDLAAFSEANSHDPVPTQSLRGKPVQGEQSLLFLQIHAAAAYFTINETLMKDPPPVLVDISKWQAGEM